MQTVNRETLLNQLESVQSGLSARELVEQSSCYVFKDGIVMTYNDEIACHQKCSLKLTGAVQAAQFKDLLHKLKEDNIQVEAKATELMIKGKGRRAGIRMEADVLLPIDSVERPEKWKDLNEDFLEAVKLVQSCASSDDSEFALICIHIHPEWVEACDNFQITRVPMKTGVKASTLVKRDALKHVVALDMTEFCETESWMHFRNPSGLVLSCRRYVEDYPNLGPLLDVKGTKATLPRGLGDAADKASVFSADTSDDNQVRIELRPGKLRIRGQGASGWYQEQKKINYKGPALAFLIAPELLIEITKKHNDCLISSTALMVDSGRFQYVSCLGAIEE